MRSCLLIGLAICFTLCPALTADAQGSRQTKDLMALQGKVAALIENAVQATVGLRLSNGQGSGVLVSAEGLVLTAAHVFDRPGQTLQIILHDGRKVSGTTLGRHDAGDYGMVRINDKGPFPFATTGSLKDQPDGALCLATGHPGGYQRGRPPVVRLGKLVSTRGPFIRTTCVIDQGDSGGPLFDMKGRVIGIHSRIRPSPEQNYHVSIEKYTESWEKLQQSRSWGRPASLGIRGADLEGASEGKGCEVERVYRRSAAEEGGLKRGDIILSVDGKKLKGVDALVEIIKAHEPGDKLHMLLLRDEKNISKVITLGTRR